MSKPRSRWAASLQKLAQEVWNFDPEEYLRAYPDVEAAGVNPWVHYFRHGIREGRMGGARVKLKKLDFSRLDPKKETVLVMGHEASRTGAPILTWNLVRELSPTYNIVSFLFGDGDLFEDFERDSDLVVGPILAPSLGRYLRPILKDLLAHTPIAFALLNSIEASAPLEDLSEARVPSLMLVHEFASYTRPKSKFRDAFRHATEVIFSADVVRQTAFGVTLARDCPRAELRAQGSCLLPGASGPNQTRDEERRILDHVFGPGPNQGAPVRILGAGYVQYRKGIDLFLTVAHEIVARLGDQAAQFVWIGGGYDPEYGQDYSMYLKDQLERLGLETVVRFQPSVSEIEYAYDSAEIMLLPSRLDPLPNVAVDFLKRGKPVLCFDQSTGVADILTEGGLGPQLVAKPFHTTSMADLLQPLIESAELRVQLEAPLKALAQREFSMPGYRDFLLERAQEAIKVQAQENSDREYFEAQDVLDPRFRAQVGRGRPLDFVRSWKSGIARPKPFPGFQPGVYQAEAMDPKERKDPTRHYLEAGRPPGSWTTSFLEPGPRSQGPTRRVGLAVLFEEGSDPEWLIRGLEASSKLELTLWIGFEDPLDGPRLETLFQGCSFEVADLAPIPAGLGTLPLAACAGLEPFRDLDVLGQIRVGKVPDAAQSLLGPPEEPLLDLWVEAMLAGESEQIVHPDQPWVEGLPRSSSWMASLRQELGLDPLRARPLECPGAGCFLVSPRLFQEFSKLGVSPTSFPRISRLRGGELEALAMAYLWVDLCQARGGSQALVPWRFPARA